MKRHLILGNGGAAISAARAIRSASDDDEITIASKEDCPAYSPVLTPYFLSGSISYQAMFCCDEHFYREQGVNFLPSKEAVKVESANHRVFFHDGTFAEYDELLVATGATPRLPDIPGARSSGIFTLRTADDARRLSEALAGAETVAVNGGGLAGLEVLDALAKRGKRLVLIGRRDYVAPRVLDRRAAAMVEARLRAQGVDLRLGQVAQRIEDEGSAKKLLLTSGDQVRADTIVVTAGVDPNVAPLEGSGVEVQYGATVDAHSRTSVEHIYAAGDVAQGPDEISGEPSVNATWTNAIYQGWAAGLNMAGRAVPRQRNLRVNIATIFGLPIASMGPLTAEDAGGDELVDVGRERYRKLIFNDGRLVGAILVGDVSEAGTLANLIERRQEYRLSPGELHRYGGFVPMTRAFLGPVPGGDTASSTSS